MHTQPRIMHTRSPLDWMNINDHLHLKRSWKRRKAPPIIYTPTGTYAVTCRRNSLGWTLSIIDETRVYQNATEKQDVDGVTIEVRIPPGCAYTDGSGRANNSYKPVPNVHLAHAGV